MAGESVQGGVLRPGVAAVPPLVSVVMANRNGAAHLRDAVLSVLAQDHERLELILVDDASADDSIAVARAAAAADARMRIVTLAQPVGPAAARNRALDLAGGDWIAVVDADDILHPQRLSRLLAAARRDGADIVADDILAFEHRAGGAVRRLFARTLARGATWIDAAQFARANCLLSRDEPLGYLKPVINARLLGDRAIRYDESLRIAEDYDLLQRLLLQGARLRLVPELTYFYRRHAASTSHRLGAGTVPAMIAADAELRRSAVGLIDARTAAALDRRLASLRSAEAHGALASALKAGRIGEAGRLALRHPAAAAGLLRILARDKARAALAGLRARGVPAPDGRPAICVLSRQRVGEGTNGSSAYLLMICRSLKAQGFVVHLVCPSPAVLGRVPVLDLSASLRVFDTVAIRGTWRIGSLALARDPMVHARAAIGIADRLARRVGIEALGRLARPAPYAVALPWTAEDFLFVAARARHAADAILADYAFLAPGIPYALCPESRSCILMHDLFSARPAEFARIGAADSVATIGKAEEARLLAQADCVIAIQEQEAALVRAMLPANRAVAVVPMGVTPVEEPQPGRVEAGLLFVGSATAPNVDALRWMIDQVLPRIRTVVPDVTLRVAGTVCAAFQRPGLPAGIHLLGRVPDLGAVYRDAAIVVCPLRAGSGLKIKLVEALAHGKAVVATGTTLQGVEPMVGGAVHRADDAQGFATAVVALLRHDAARAALAAAALGVARQHFAASQALGSLPGLMLRPGVMGVERRSFAA